MAAGAPARSGAPESRRATRRPGGRAGPVYDAASLLAVAVEEFNTRGYDATSMEDISRAAGITKSSFYHHVTGKEDLLRAALERALDGLFGILDEPDVAGRPPLDRLRHIVRRQVEVLPGRAALRHAAAAGARQHRDRAWALARGGLRRRARVDLVREAVEHGEVRADVDPALAARLISGMVNSIVEWYRPGRPGAEGLPEDVVRAPLRGRPPHHRPGSFGPTRRCARAGLRAAGCAVIRRTNIRLRRAA